MGKNLEFLNFTFKDGFNVTVRLGTKWAERVKPGHIINACPSDEESQSFEVLIHAMYVGPIKDIPESWLELEHDPGCRTLDGLLDELKKTYSDAPIGQETIITALKFRSC